MAREFPQRHNGFGSFGFRLRRGGAHAERTNGVKCALNCSSRLVDPQPHKPFRVGQVRQLALALTLRIAFAPRCCAACFDMPQSQVFPQGRLDPGQHRLAALPHPTLAVASSASARQDGRGLSWRWHTARVLMGTTAHRPRYAPAQASYLSNRAIAS
jgi:hypothetical protein